jgi:Uma2 family endonuclease
MSEGIQTRRWTRAEYDRLIEIGVFQPGDRVELLGGELIVAEPQSEPHYAAIGLIQEALRAALGPGWVVRPQGPIALDDESEPEPDIAVVPGTWRDYGPDHPTRPVLVIEVAASSLYLDRKHKGSLYARAALIDYWILDLAHRRLEVYRDAAPDAAAPFGWRYASVQHLGVDATIAPLAAPDARVRVSDLLP